MRFWPGKRTAARTKHASLSIELLEERALLAAMPLVSGQAFSFHDADGSRVKVLLTGPGQGSIELTNGLITGANIDNITLTDTNGQTSLKITAKGGTINGTTLNELVIDNAINELGALERLYAPKVDLAAGGSLTADGDIADIRLRSLGAGADVDVNGTIARFVANTLFGGSAVEAEQIDYLHVRKNVQNATIDVGAGGLDYAKFKNVYLSEISSAGVIHQVIVCGTIVGSALASNIDAGSDEVFGTIDDYVIDPNATGGINHVRVKGSIGAFGGQTLKLISSDDVGTVQLSRKASQFGAQPIVWQQAASQFIPLSISQIAAAATGYGDDDIWIAVYGEEITIPTPGNPPASGQNYYLVATNLNGSNPVLTTTANLTPMPNTTPNLPILPSSTIQDWAGNLAFPVPIAGSQWTGRILISVGAPVQAQVNQDQYHSVASPSANGLPDPSTGTFYDFLEFTVTNNNGTASLDIDTSQVDSFGMPLSLQFFKDAAGTMPFNSSFIGTSTQGSQTISGIDSNTLNLLVTQNGLATGQPITGPGIQPGTTIVNYNIPAGQILINKPADNGAQAGGTFEVTSAGPVGVTVDRATILAGATNDALYDFLQNKVDGGSTQARPFLQSAAPFPISGPVPINGIEVSGATINFAGNMGNLGTGDVINISGVQGATALNGSFVVAVAVPGTITLGGPLSNGTYLNGTGTFSINGGAPQPITGAQNSGTNGAIQISSSASTASVTVGDVITISGVQGNTAANGTFLVAGKNGNAIVLGSPFGNQSYTSGGTFSRPPLPINGATAGSPITIDAATSTYALSSNDQVIISDLQGITNANGTFTAEVVTGSSFQLGGTNGTGTWVNGSGTWAPVFTITGAALAGPMTIVTDSTAGLNDGDTVVISGVQGTTSANGVFTIANTTATSFTLNDAIANGQYISGGVWALPIAGATTASSTIITNDTTGLANGDVVTITGVQGNTSVNGQFVAQDVTPTSFALGGPIGNGAYTSGGYWALPFAQSTPITGASNAGPITITTGHTTGLANGDTVWISGVQGNSAANGLFTVASVSPTSFQLSGSTGNGAYTQGGTWQRVMPISGASNDGNPIVITTPDTTGLALGGVVRIAEVGGNTAANGLFVVADRTATTITLGSPASTTDYTMGGNWSGGSGSGAVSDVGTGGQIIITTSNTQGLEGHDLVDISGVLGNTAANGFYVIDRVTSTSFALVGSLGNGTFQSSASTAGTWTEYTRLSRLVSPKDILDGLSSPQDPSALNNYFNATIDEFFLKYLPSDQTVNGRQGGGETLLLASSASGSDVVYSGTVTNQFTENGGYVLRFTTGSQPTAFSWDTLDVYYPFFTTNAPSADVYTPLFPLAAPPSWITAANQQGESASQMIFACDALFADNVERTALGMSQGQQIILADLENSISAAFNRGIALNPADTWGDTSTWFPETGTYNYWVEYWHQPELTYNSLAYAFPYDDKFGASTNLNFSNVGLAQIILGHWGQMLQASTTAFTSVPASVALTGTVTLSATVTGTSPTGTVSFFINGLPINETIHSSNPPLHPVTIDNQGVATITAQLPSLPNTGNNQLYTLTAVYSGDDQNLPSLAVSSLLVTT